jgi:enediyne biosynthesis protein E4
LIVKLQGRGANRDAIGTRLIAHVGPRILLRTIDGGGSYLSAGDPRVHFGLGAVERVDRLEVHWPSGKVETRFNLPVNTTVEWVEGA